VKIREMKLKGFYEITSTPFEDNRGFLDRVYDRKIFIDNGIDVDWVQESHSYTKQKDIVRGIHFTQPPYTEAKLIRIVKGRMVWLMLDLRPESSTFGEWESVVLEEGSNKFYFVERGFGHGCASLTNDCHLFIQTDQYYSQEHGSGIRWDDPNLSIDWQVEIKNPLVSKGHQNYLSFNDYKEKYKNIKIEY
jgi:dTDP-4-dehydrorhamnose 3,5-epimerase